MALEAVSRPLGREQQAIGNDRVFKRRWKSNVDVIVNAIARPPRQLGCRPQKKRLF